MLKSIYAQEDREAACKKAEEVASKLERQALGKVAKLIRAGAEETFSFYDYPGQPLAMHPNQ